MPKMGDSMGDYLKTLRQRAKDSHVYKKYQLTGLQIAEILGDSKHKALYIKLAKEGNGDRLLGIAKDVAERAEVKNKGAYFMRIISSEAIDKKNKK
jgi:copper(I)-binding protein